MRCLNFNERRFYGGREALKWIAIITMTIDHAGAVFYPEHIFLRLIGRLAFPLFCYLIILGMESTRNVKNYFIRLLVFASISQIPYYLALGYEPYESLNIFFTLSFGVLFIYFYERRSILILIPILASIFLRFDFSIYGILLIGCAYALKKDTKLGIVLICLLNVLSLLLWERQIFSLFALPIILLHLKISLKIERETKLKFAYPLWRKYFFYIFYPLHLTVLYLISNIG